MRLYRAFFSLLGLLIAPGLAIIVLVPSSLRTEKEKIQVSEHEIL